MTLKNLTNHFKWLARRKSPTPLESDPHNQLSNSKVIWDAADDRSLLSSRRGLAVNIAVALLGLSSLAAPEAAQRYLLKRAPRIRLAGTQHTATCPAGTSHSDSFDDNNIHQDACK